MSVRKGIKESNGVRRTWGRRASLDYVVLRWALRGGYICTQSWGETASTVRVWGKRTPVRGLAGAEAEMGLSLRQKWAWQIQKEKGAWRVIAKGERGGKQNSDHAGLRIWILCAMLWEVMEHGPCWVQDHQTTPTLLHLYALSTLTYLEPLSTASRVPSYVPLPFPSSSQTWSQISWVLIPALLFTSWMTLGKLLNISFSFLAWKME